MDDLNPITRTERLLDGEDLTPTNREEMFIKRIYDKTQEIPEPVNRKEYFLKKAGEAGGDVTVVPLSVTSNGTYSEEGKAYSPVTVEVEPPEDSYQLKSITTPTSLATFNASAMPMPSLKVSVEAKQDLHGYDYPWVGGAGKNKWADNLNWYRNNAANYESNADTSTTRVRNSPAIPFDYAGKTMTLSGIPSGLELNDLAFFDESKNFISWSSQVNNTFTVPSGTKYAFIMFNGTNLTDDIKTVLANADLQIEEGSIATTFEPYSNICPISGWDAANVSDVDDVDNPTVTQTTTITLPQTVYGGEVDVVNGVLTITHEYIASYNGETLPSTWISSMDVYAEGTTPTIGAEVCYERANPISTNLTPSLIKSLEGTNNLSVDCGDVIEGEYFKALGGE